MKTSCLYHKERSQGSCILTFGERIQIRIAATLLVVLLTVKYKQINQLFELQNCVRTTLFAVAKSEQEVRNKFPKKDKKDAPN